MGLFGVLASVFSCGVLVVDTAQGNSFMAEQKQKAVRDGRMTYGDGRGNEYLVSTGEKVYTHGGKIYSAKHPTVVLYDMVQEYCDRQTKDSIRKAQEKGEKRTLITLPNVNSPSGYSNYYVEVSTMKRFKVYPIVYLSRETHRWEFAFYKQYLTNDGHSDGDSVKITRKEFEELGGYIPYNMDASEYVNYKHMDEKEKKRYIKKTRGI